MRTIAVLAPVGLADRAPAFPPPRPTPLAGLVALEHAYPEPPACGPPCAGEADGPPADDHRIEALPIPSSGARAAQRHDDLSLAIRWPRRFAGARSPFRIASPAWRRSAPPSLRRHYPDQVQTVGGRMPPSQPVYGLPLSSMVLRGSARVNPGSATVHMHGCETHMHAPLTRRAPSPPPGRAAVLRLRGPAGRARPHSRCSTRPSAAARTSSSCARRRPGCTEELVSLADPFRRAAAEHGALFVLNDRPDLVEACGADGVHVGQEDAPVAEARELAGPEALVGLSTHSAEQVAAACAAAGDGRPDQLSVGPVWATPTKAGRPATGLGLIEFAAREATIPWFAIGGIDAGNVAERGGRRGVADRRRAGDPRRRRPGGRRTRAAASPA